MHHEQNAPDYLRDGICLASKSKRTKQETMKCKRGLISQECREFLLPHIRDSCLIPKTSTEKRIENLKAKKGKIEFTKRLKPDHKSPAYTRNIYCLRSEK